MAKSLKLTVLCGPYEMVRALREGTVRPKGIDLEFVRCPGGGEIHEMVARDEGADVNEFNGGAYVMAKSLGRKFTALPVFLHRRFRHGFIFVHAKSGIEKPADLIAKKMGSRTYMSAADFWMRGLLEDEYGVAPGAMQWFTQDPSELRHPSIKGVKIKRIPKGRKIEDMFVRGEIDALQSPACRGRSSRAMPASAVYFPITKRPRRNISSAPASFPSCTSPRSAAKSSSSIPGSCNR